MSVDSSVQTWKPPHKEGSGCKSQSEVKKKKSKKIETICLSSGVQRPEIL